MAHSATLRQKNISFLEEKQPSAQRGSQLKWARLPDITFFIFCKVSCRNRKSNAEDDFGDNSALEQVDALLPLRPSNQRIDFFAPQRFHYSTKQELDIFIKKTCVGYGLVW